MTNKKTFNHLPIGFDLGECFKSLDNNLSGEAICKLISIIEDQNFITDSLEDRQRISKFMNISFQYYWYNISRLIENYTIINNDDLQLKIKQLLLADNDRKNFYEHLDQNHFNHLVVDNIPNKNNKKYAIIMMNRIFMYYYENELFWSNDTLIEQIKMMIIMMILMLNEFDFYEYIKFIEKDTHESVSWKNVLLFNNRSITQSTYKSNNIKTFFDYCNEILNHKETLSANINDLFYIYVNTIIPIIHYFAITKIAPDFNKSYLFKI